ncbi:MAG: preprotein translocase subunit SecE [Tyzzerella sp.]|uniref:Protein translocase subunit SecE n=1 Tax=Candidatus Fimicola merdigallinarum TaxID=2840819 RepID=A0A9D9DVT7_9FIRM|nr:preprotein translocase subunit SecE [Candidatus Fimicola merdigallinarum]
MQKQNTTNPNEKNESKEKKSKAKKQSKKSDKPSFAETVADYKAEFKKIIWPNRSETVKNTITVIVTSLLMGAIIFCIDTVVAGGYNFILGLLG